MDTRRIDSGSRRDLVIASERQRDPRPTSTALGVLFQFAVWQHHPRRSALREQPYRGLQRICFLVTSSSNIFLIIITNLHLRRQTLGEVSSSPLQIRLSGLEVRRKPGPGFLLFSCFATDKLRRDFALLLFMYHRATFFHTMADNVAITQRSRGDEHSSHHSPGALRFLRKLGVKCDKGVVCCHVDV